MFDFEKFSVYQKAEACYKQVLIVLSNPRIDKIVRDQFKRASLSIVLNIAEGSGKYTKNDKKNFYVIAKGSTNECIAILRILRIEDNITDEDYKKLYLSLYEVAKMLSGLISSMIRR